MDFTIDDATSVSVWLSWNSNHNGGSPQQFVVYYREVCEDSDCGFIRDSILDDLGLNIQHVHNVLNLDENTQYEFKVIAVNSYNGVGGNTSSTELEMTTTAGRPL